jgi:hypothetical protein
VGNRNVLEPIFEFFTPVERLRVFTPLGIRFWDPARDIQVTEDLIVMARPQGRRHVVSHAFRTASGIYAFQGLPGLQEVEYPSGTSALTASPPAITRFVVEVTDAQRRFLPLVFSVDVPSQGIFPTTMLSSPLGSGPSGFYLFSSPTRPVMPSLAVVRAQLEELIEPEQRRPAAHALLEVRIPGQPTAYGLADERGCVAVLFPYPAFIGASSGASPLTSLAAASPQRWVLSISVRYDPPALTVPIGSKLPDLRSICSQAPGVIWSTLVVQPGQTVTQFPAELTFGEELVLRTDDESALLISSAASPL